MKIFFKINTKDTEGKKPAQGVTQRYGKIRGILQMPPTCSSACPVC